MAMRGHGLVVFALTACSSNVNPLVDAATNDVITADVTAIDASADTSSSDAPIDAPGPVSVSIAHGDSVATAIEGDLSALTVACSDLGSLLDTCSTVVRVAFSAIVGDANLDGTCANSEKGTVTITVKTITGSITTTSGTRTLTGNVTLSVATAPLRLRTHEAHSTLCGALTPIQDRIFYSHDATFAIQLDVTTPTTTPPSSLKPAIAQSIVVAGIGLDGTSTASGTASYAKDGCDAQSGTYAIESSPGVLACGQVLQPVTGSCAQSDPNQLGVCDVAAASRDYVLGVLQGAVADSVATALVTELTKL